ncbi:hypothetical protein KM043_007108 [Ampulex compressa]|nr:hypothetical protein KM043_007108 [Ampulex compressa]
MSSRKAGRGDECPPPVGGREAVEQSHTGTGPNMCAIPTHGVYSLRTLGHADTLHAAFHCSPSTLALDAMARSTHIPAEGVACANGSDRSNTGKRRRADRVGRQVAALAGMRSALPPPAEATTTTAASIATGRPPFFRPEATRGWGCVSKPNGIA